MSAIKPTELIDANIVILTDVIAHNKMLKETISHLEAYCKNLEAENESLSNRLAIKEEPIILIINPGGKSI
ncbi:hypothetical protein [Effusibacillus dendaii]|uniref:Uncharacterized protein n=1 Tax=Effusibacillus dendaii TaxID=2743772 RepID=A0A7I8DAX0_9BACL|nr:hypothetical protein [Effusibacillus dendaii]BCJ86492.1 hypothetical protein skT53_14770 [Effusibacillus dendaii]